MVTNLAEVPRMITLMVITLLQSQSSGIISVRLVSTTDCPPSSQATLACGTQEVKLPESGTASTIHALRAYLTVCLSVILHCSQVFVLSCRSLPSFAVRQSVQWSVGRFTWASRPTSTLFFPFLPFTSNLSLFPIQTLLYTHCAWWAVWTGPSSFSIGFFFLGFISYVRVLFSQVFFCLPRIREYRPGRFPSHAFVSPVAAPPKHLIASVLFIFDPRAGLVRTEG